MENFTQRLGAFNLNVGWHTPTSRVPARLHLITFLGCSVMILKQYWVEGNWYANNRGWWKDSGDNACIKMCDSNTWKLILLQLLPLSLEHLRDKVNGFLDLWKLCILNGVPLAWDEKCSHFYSFGVFPLTSTKFVWKVIFLRSSVSRKMPSWKM